MIRILHKVKGSKRQEAKFSVGQASIQHLQDCFQQRAESKKIGRLVSTTRTTRLQK